MTDSRRRLRALPVAGNYRSDRQDVVAEFYVPALSAATSYDRAVGYFTSTSLAIVARGLEAFAERGGAMRLVASPHLTPEDVDEIDRGYDARDILSRAALRELDAETNERVLAGLGRLGKLIAAGQLDIKLAFVQRGQRIGLYHEKIGVFRDSVGDVIAFTGSANETMGGLLANFESVEVYRSWAAGDEDRALRIVRDFTALWQDETTYLQVMDFPAVAADRLKELAQTARTVLPPRDDALLPTVEEPDREGLLRMPRGLRFRDYQKDAVSAWWGAGRRGILKMATGTGKTKTALAAATQLSRALRQRGQRLVTVVLVPYQHLVDQWIEEVAAFGATALPAYESSARWAPRAAELINAVNLGVSDGAVIVASNATFALEPFQGLLERIQAPLLVIADEAHNLGARRLRAALPPRADYRLALSATPERWFDDVGTDALKEYFGDVVYELGLGKAIELGALSRYVYRPRLIELDDDEAALYVKVSDAIATCLRSGEQLVNDEQGDGPLGQLLRKRAQILGHATRKLGVFQQDLTARKERWYQLVYCAEGRHPEAAGDADESGADEPGQVAQVLQLAGRGLGLSAHDYVAETPRAERQELLRRFGSGDDLRVLVSMRCLDEGVDIPDARVAYILASSSNPRQFVQRRGRILRRAPGKTHAEIMDYLAVPPPGALEGREALERRLLERELSRAGEFARLAENYGEILGTLRPVKERYGLMDL